MSAALTSFPKLLAVLPLDGASILRMHYRMRSPCVPLDPIALECSCRAQQELPSHGMLAASNCRLRRIDATRAPVCISIRPLAAPRH